MIHAHAMVTNVFLLTTVIFSKFSANALVQCEKQPERF